MLIIVKVASAGKNRLHRNRSESFAIDSTIHSLRRNPGNGMITRSADLSDWFYTTNKQFPLLPRVFTDNEISGENSTGRRIRDIPSEYLILTMFYAYTYTSGWITTIKGRKSAKIIKFDNCWTQPLHMITNWKRYSVNQRESARKKGNGETRNNNPY